MPQLFITFIITLKMSAERKNFEYSLPKLVELEVPLSSWDKQFKTAIDKGDKADDDLFEGLVNDFDKEDW